MRDGDKKVVYEKVKETEDEFGERTRREIDYSYRIPVEPEFVKMYVDDVASLNHITGVHRAILCFMASLMDYDNKVVLSPEERKRWQVELGVAQSTVNNAISHLIRRGHIKKNGSGEYIVCPSMFSKGHWKKTMQKRDSFDAHFTVRYERTKAGYTRTVRESIVKPIGSMVDMETGELLYKYKRGGPFVPKQHNDSDIVSHTIEDDASDIDPETGDVY